MGTTVKRDPLSNVISESYESAEGATWISPVISSEVIVTSCRPSNTPILNFDVASAGMETEAITTAASARETILFFIRIIDSS